VSALPLGFQMVVVGRITRQLCQAAFVLFSLLTSACMLIKLKMVVVDDITP
jgi:hypothetical protein